jgi:hypothetical protein
LKTVCPKHRERGHCNKCNSDYEWTDDDRVWSFSGGKCPNGCEEEVEDDEDDDRVWSFAGVKCPNGCEEEVEDDDDDDNYDDGDGEDDDEICEGCANGMADDEAAQRQCENCHEFYAIDDVYHNKRFYPDCEDGQERAERPPGDRGLSYTASPAAVRVLLKKKLDKSMLGAESGDPACGICRSEVELGTKVRVLPCRHWFHGKCIRIWLEGASRNCLFCRRPIPEPDIDQVAAAGPRSRRQTRRPRPNRPIRAGRLPPARKTRRVRSTHAPEDDDFAD